MKKDDARYSTLEQLHEWRKQVVRLYRKGYGVMQIVKFSGLSYEQRPVEVKAWLDNSYPVIAERAKAEGAETHWGDETGLRSDDVRGRSFPPKGKTSVVRVNSKRENMGLISTVTNQGKVRWMVLNGALDSDQLIAFLKRLVKDARHKVFLILDNLRVHHAKLVKAWLAKHQGEIEEFICRATALS